MCTCWPIYQKDQDSGDSCTNENFYNIIPSEVLGKKPSPQQETMITATIVSVCQYLNCLETSGLIVSLFTVIFALPTKRMLSLGNELISVHSGIFPDPSFFKNAIQPRIQTGSTNSQVEYSKSPADAPGTDI